MIPAQNQLPWSRHRYPVCLPLLLFSLSAPLGQGAIHIPYEYKAVLKHPPAITAEPESYTAFVPEDIILTCDASGNPSPVFRWLKDGHQFDPASDSQFTTSENSGNFSVASPSSPLSSFQGRYRCYASNELGTAMSKEVDIITENTPTLPKEKPMKITEEEGKSIILECNPPNSTVHPNIHWMDKNLRHIELSSRVTNGLDGNLYFANLVHNDTRDDYTCHAQYIRARTILPKERIYLTVLSSNSLGFNRRPHLLRPVDQQHTSITALRHQSLTLECIAGGLPTPSIQWQKRDGLLSESRTSKLNFDRWLKFNKISEDDDGEYQCTAANLHGVATHTFIITVEAAPYWNKQPESQLYAPGETVLLECKAEGIPTPRVGWSLNGIPITDVDPDPRRRVIGGTLTLTDLVPSDTAMYQCEATNKHGSILVNTHVYVIELPPQILTQSNILYKVTEGQTADLECRTFGSPKPKVFWENNSYETLLSNPRISLLVNGSLKISNVSQEDVGSYACTVTDSELSISAQLEVYNKTTIVSPSTHLRVLRGHSATLCCAAQADARLKVKKVQWRKNLENLKESPSDDKYTYDGFNLTVSDVQSGDSGVYHCEVSTALDKAVGSSSLIAVDRPDPPTQVQLSDIRGRSLTVSWTPGDHHNSEISEFMVQLEEKKFGEGKWKDAARVAGDIERVEIQLQPFLVYRFRVSAVNEFGHSDPSAPSEWHAVAPAAPDRNPRNVRIEPSEPNKLTIAWEEMDTESHNGPNFHYKVMWRSSSGTDSKWNHRSEVSSPVVVEKAGIYMPFEIKVQAANQHGKGPDPKSVYGYSGEDLPLRAPEDIEVQDVKSTTVLLKWSPLHREFVQGHLLGYKIKLKRLGWRSFGAHVKHERHHDSQVIEVLPDKKEELFQGLQPFSRYELTLSAFNSKGTGPESEPHFFETHEGVPGPPSSLEFDSPSETELILYWTPPKHPNGKLTGYILQYQVMESNRGLNEVEYNDPDITLISLSDLDPHSQYNFYLRALTSVGPGEAIHRQGATLLDGVPPSNVSVSAGETYVNLSWVPQKRHRNVGFHLRYLSKNGGQWEMTELINSTQNFYQLQGLKAGSQYRLQIIFINSTYWETAVVTDGPRLLEVQTNFASQGWFIGLISAVVLLLLVLLILCFIKRSKGGKYSVKDKEEGQVDSEVRPMKDDAFGEYSDNEEKHSLSQQPSLCGESKLGSDDSLAGYGDSVDIQFNEDGSFIGQYSGHRDVPGHGGQDSSGATSPVNPIIPPLPSMIGRGN